jgi:hypothetical protein
VNSATISRMSLIMKAGYLRPSCVKRIPAVAAPPANCALAAELSSGPALVRPQDRIMITQAKQIRAKFSPWSPTALWISLRSLVERRQPDCHSATLRGGKLEGVFPAIEPRPKVRVGKLCLSPTRMDGGHVLRFQERCHLWLVLRSEEHRRGALWETVGFLAIWLSGIIGVAICVLG